MLPPFFRVRCLCCFDNFDGICFTSGLRVLFGVAILRKIKQKIAINVNELCHIFMSIFVAVAVFPRVSLSAPPAIRNLRDMFDAATKSARFFVWTFLAIFVVVIQSATKFGDPPHPPTQC